MLVTTWNDTISNFGKRTVGHLLQDERDCPRDLEPSPKWKCKQWKTTDHYFFDGGWEGGGGGVKGLENFHMQTVFLCFRLHASSLIFTSIQFISVRTASANNLFHNFPTPLPPPPRQKNNGPSLTFFHLHTLFICKFPTISRLFFLKSLGATWSPGRFSSTGRGWSRSAKIVNSDS